MSELGNEARRFLRGQHNAVLATLSQRLAGHPFASVTPFITDHAGRPVLLISGLAEHTRNISADPRVSLIVQPFSEDMQATARVTLVGQAVPLAAGEGLGSRYLRRLPQAEAYFNLPDFQFYRLEPVRIRYIGGFGRIHWLEAGAFLCDAGRLAESEDAILAHMNADHADSLRAYARHFLQIDGAAAEMTGIDPDGLDLRVGAGNFRIGFPAPVLDPEAARQTLAALAREARA
jgi:hypothetical protein